MKITSPAYHGLIQTQWEARDANNDPKLTDTRLESQKRVLS